jgi:hypothetical protein
MLANEAGLARDPEPEPPQASPEPAQPPCLSDLYETEADYARSLLRYARQRFCICLNKVELTARKGEGNLPVICRCAPIVSKAHVIDALVLAKPLPFTMVGRRGGSAEIISALKS